MRYFLILLVLVFSLGSYAQKVIEKEDDVKNPKEGKLYYSKSGNRLTLYANGKFQLVKEVDGTVEPPVVKPPAQGYTELEVGYWGDKDRILVLVDFGDGKKWLIQTDPARSKYIVRGKNLLQNASTVITYNGVIHIDGDDSELGGLYGSPNFKDSYFSKNGFTKNSVGEWRKEEDGDDSNQVIDTGVLKTIPNYPKPSGQNRTNWADFPDFQMPNGILNVGGYGFPLYADEPLYKGGMLPLAKGWTQIANADTYERAYFKGENTYYFNQVHFLIIKGARNALANGWNGGEYGDVAYIAGLDYHATDIDYTRVTSEGAIAIGRGIYDTNCCTMPADGTTWDVKRDGGVIMMDEESLKGYGDHGSFLGLLNQGMWERSGGKLNIFWYAQPISRWYFYNMYDIPSMSDSQLEAGLSADNLTMNGSGWRNSSWYVDANVVYSKVPYLSKVNIYEKDSKGNFVLDSKGFRKFRSESFTIDIFGKDVQIHKEPVLGAQNYVYNINGGESFGYATNPETGKPYTVWNGSEWVVESNSYNKGWRFHTNSQNISSHWQPETKLWQEGIYFRANETMSALLHTAYIERGDWNIVTRTQKYKTYAEQRPMTEPWTRGGNDIFAREVGDNQIWFDVFMSLYSGVNSLSSWDDGFWLTNIPKQGEKLFGQDDDWTRYHSKLAAIQESLKGLEGTNPNEWKHVHFYQPYMGSRYSEVISSGIYHKGKLYIFFLNPTLENKEKQELKLEAGGKSYSLDLIGHEFYYGVYDVQDGLDTRDFKLSYTTIYGRNVKVNGKVTNKINEHYE